MAIKVVSTEPVIPREQRPVIASYLAERLAGPVAIEVWTQRESALVRTDRDPCTFCEPLASAARQLAAMHPLITLTPYDLDKHAERALEAGIERPPVTVLRGRNGREVRFVGLWSGLLFSPLMDAMLFLGAGFAPIKEETREGLKAIEKDLKIELLVAPYDPYSAHTLRVATAFAVESARLHVEAIEVSEFPRLADSRMISEIPVMTVNDRRYIGAWNEEELLQQLHRIANEDADPVIREHVLTSPFMTVEQAQELAAREAQGLPAQGVQGQPPSTPGGLIIPGR